MQLGPPVVPITKIKTDDDGKGIFTQTPRLPGLSTWFHGAGDQVSPLRRGAGDKLKAALLGGDNATAEIQYVEPIWLHDGGVLWDNTSGWGIDDSYEFYVRIPANTLTANAGAGNCNVVNGYVIVPAANDGSDDITLASAIPVPAADEDNPDGYWDVDDDGVVTASATPGAAKFHLLTVEQKPYLMRSMPLLGPRGMFDIDAYELKFIHHRWFIGLYVDKVSTGIGNVRAWLLGYRKKVTES